MVSWLLSHAEYLALGLNAFMAMAFLVQRDAPKTLYWGGATLVVMGVIMMRTK